MHLMHMMERVITPCEHDGGHGSTSQSTMETFFHMYNTVLEWAQAMEGSYLYNEGEGTLESMIWIIRFLICLDLDLSQDISMQAWDVQQIFQCCLSQGVPQQESHLFL